MLANIFARSNDTTENIPEPLWSVHSPRANGSFQGKVGFDDMDMLESGNAREYLSKECLSPVDSRDKWSRCYANRVAKAKFYMFQEGHSTIEPRFLLSAKLEDGTFYISQYQAFPEETNSVPKSGFVAVLRPDMKSRSYRLFLCGCEDPETYFQLEKHACVGSEEEQMDGQLLADISHSTKIVERADAEMRALTVAIPAIKQSSKQRAIWSPRTTRVRRTLFERQHSGVRSANLSMGPTSGSDTSTYGSSSGSDSCASSDSGSSDGGRDAGIGGDIAGGFLNLSGEDTIALESKLPEWNDSIQSLVLKFTGGRVTGASAKNFLLADKVNMAHPILQFGKSAKGKYVVDFRSPIAPIQAFAVFLTATAWIGKT